MLQVGLQSRHGSQVAVDEGDAPFLRIHLQGIQQILHHRTGWQFDQQVGVTGAFTLTAKPCQVAIEPCIHLYILHRSSSNGREHPNLVTLLKIIGQFHDAPIYETDLYFFIRDLQPADQVLECGPWFNFQWEGFGGNAVRGKNSQGGKQFHMNEHFYL